MIKIPDLNKLLAPELERENKVLVSYTTKNLTAPGENYGSVMLAVEAKVKCIDNDNEEDLHLVAKLCPPSEFIRQVFNTPVTFIKEAGFYYSVIPTLQEFQKERGCEVTYTFFAKHYGSRFNLKNTNEVDDDACLLLENLKIKGYGIADRLKGFDLTTAKYLIKDLAKFHAVPIALKIAKPEVFKKHIQPFLSDPVNQYSFSEELRNGVQKIITDCLNKNKECARYCDRVQAMIKRSEKVTSSYSILKGREPFNTIVHNDFWVNNTMFKTENGKPTGNCMVDFQMTYYGNPAHDLLFFIYSSLSNDIIADNYKKLVDLYFDTFIDVLKELKIDTDIFGYDTFLDLIDEAAIQYQCYHILFMLKPIFTDKDKVKELGDMNANELNNTETLSELYFPKLWGSILDFVDKKWL